MAGLTSEGFEQKRLDEIQTDINDGFITSIGNINTSPESTFGQIRDVNARLLTELWEQMGLVYDSAYPSTATGVNLDNIVALNGITRLESTYSVAVVQLQTDETTTPPTVPVGTTFQQQGSDLLLDLDADVTISDDNLQRLIMTVTSVTAGTYSLEIDGETIGYTAGGSETEGEIVNELRDGINVNPVLSVYLTATTSGAVLTVAQNDTSSTTNNFQLVTFDSPSASEFETTEFWTPGSATVQTDSPGAIPLPAESITQIVDSVTNLTAVTNLSQGVEGRNEETDPELRARRADSVQTSSSGTLASIREDIQETEDTTYTAVFENETDVIDSEGRPPHSLELVVDGPRTTAWEQTIGETLFLTKPAGIQTYRDPSSGQDVTVIDTNGSPQIVSFSYPTNVDIYIDVEVTSTTDAGQSLPTDWEDQVKAALVDYFSTLEIGEDVVYQKLFTPIYSVQGIGSVVLQIGTAPSPTGTSNIAIASRELAVTDATKITTSLAP